MRTENESTSEQTAETAAAGGSGAGTVTDTESEMLAKQDAPAPAKATKPGGKPFKGDGGAVSRDEFEALRARIEQVATRVGV